MGLPFFMEHHTAREYQAQPQNWGVVQDSRGVVYVANRNGILTYDGVSWRIIQTPTLVRSLALGEDGIVHVGLQSDFGYLQPDSTGTLQYVSLLDEIDSDDEGPFWDVWGTHQADGDVYFQTSRRIFRWDGTEMTSWSTDGRFHTSFAVDGQFYVRELDVGLQQIEGDSLRLVPGGERFANRPIYMIAPFDEQHVLIGTQKGFYLYDGSSVSRFPTEVDDYVDEHDFYHGTAIPGGSFALATVGGGVVVIDKQGQLIQVLDEASGALPDDGVNYVYPDAQGGLWMALNSRGVARADVPSKLTMFDKRLGIRGIIQEVLRHQGALYVATNEGVFRMEEALNGLGEGRLVPHFTKIDNVTNTWSLLSFDDVLLAATDRGVFQIRGGQGYALEASPATGQVLKKRATVRNLLKSQRYERTVYAGTEQGLDVLRLTDSGWVRYQNMGHLDGHIWSLLEDADGTLWFTTLHDRVGGLHITEDTEKGLTAASMDTMTHASRGSLYLIRIAGNVILGAEEGLFRIEDSGEEGDGFAVVRDTLLSDHLQDRYGSSKPLLGLTEDQAGNIWMARRDRVEIAVPQGDGTYAVEGPPVLSFDRVNVPQIYVEDNGVAWIGNGGSELIRYDPRVPKDYATGFTALIRRVVTLQTHRVVYGGAAPRLTPRANPGERPAVWEFDYVNNDLRFDVAAPSFNRTMENEFQYYMEGHDSGWTDWTTKTSRTYTNLWEGRYTLRVRARNAQGVVSSEAAFRFHVLPPWYRSGWAYAGYALLLGLGTFLLMKYRRAVQENREARKQAEELARERIVNERLQQANERLQEVNELKDTFLANTSHELRTPLTGILGFTTILKDEVSDDHHREFLGLIEENGQRLLETVNSLLDMAKLQAGEMEMQREPVDLHKQARKVVRGLDALVQQKGLEIRLHGSERSAYAKLDRGSFEQVLYNLISNAIKFTEEGHIDVTVGRDDGRAFVRVRDTGIGIDESFMPHLFEAFKQESSGTTRSHEGSGLGLTITSRLVEIMDGEITVESTKGEGSTFTVSFPAHVPHAQTSAPAPA